MDQMITAKQCKCIHTLAHQLGMSDRTYRQRLGRIGAKSCKDLSFRQAKAFIRGLVELVNKRAGRPTAGYARITTAQIAKARFLWAKVSHHDDSDAREVALNAFVQRQCGVDSIYWVPKHKVPALLCALQSMSADQARQS